MPLISDADIQIHLPVDKLKVEEIPDELSDAKRDTEAIIRGMLAGVLEAATLAAWTTPELTPAQIRAIGGRLAAALIYRLRLAEDSDADPEYAQNKYNEAMMMLQGIISGTIVLDGVVDVTTPFSNDWFAPNANTAEPKFTMESVF